MYHDPVLERLFGRVIDEYAEFQFYVWDDEREEVVGAGNAIPAAWDGMPRRCPTAGVDAVVEASFANDSPTPNVLCALQILIAPEFRPGPEQPNDPADGRDRPLARARHADRSRPAQSQAQLPADTDRALHRVAPTRRHAPRPVAPHARAPRSRDREGRTRVDAHPGHGRPVGGVDGARVPGERLVRRARRARPRRDRPRARRRALRRAERLDGAPASTARRPRAA